MLVHRVHQVAFAPVGEEEASRCADRNQALEAVGVIHARRHPAAAACGRAVESLAELR